jgi:hypothetical protein
MKVEVRYATEFGSQTLIMNVKKIPNFTRKFTILSIKPI